MASLPMHATPMMATVGLTPDEVIADVQHALHLVQTLGPTFIGVLKLAIVGYGQFVGHDVFGLLATVRELGSDVTAIVAAVKAEFGL